MVGPSRIAWNRHEFVRNGIILHENHYARASIRLSREKGKVYAAMLQMFMWKLASDVEINPKNLANSFMYLRFLTSLFRRDSFLI